jgi:hypothetical protein
VRPRRNIDGNRVLHWLERWGFAAMVGTAVVASLFVGVMVAVPSDVPAIALQATAVYRLEAGGAIFVGLYVVTTAFVLALQNRAFTRSAMAGSGRRACRICRER